MVHKLRRAMGNRDARYTLEGILRNPINFSKKFTPTIHKVVAPDGTYHWVIGYFLTEEEARGTQVHDAVIPNPRMVFISPTIYKVLP